MRSGSLLIVTCLALSTSLGCYANWTAGPHPSSSSGELAKNQREVTGRIASYTTAPRGEMDGFILDTGNRVHIPIHTGTTLSPLLQKGDVITVVGTVTDRPEGKVIEAITITNVDKNRTVDVASIAPPRSKEPVASQTEGVPPPGKTKSTTTLTGASLTAKEGHVQGYTTGPTGDMDGVLLDNGVRIHFPTQAGKALLPLVQQGKAIRVVGWEITGPEGTLVEATKIVETTPNGRTVDISEIAAPPEPKPTPGAVSPPGSEPLGQVKQQQQQQQRQQKRR